MVQVRSDLAQGAEYKLPVGKIHMGDAKIGFTQDQVVIKEDVQIQCPGSPAQNTFPSSLLFNVVEPVQKLSGSKESAKLQTAVQKIILVCHAVGFRDQKIRNCLHLAGGGFF